MKNTFTVKKSLKWVKQHPIVIVEKDDVEIKEDGLHWYYQGVYQGKLKDRYYKYIMAPNCSHTERLRNIKGVKL